MKNNNGFSIVGILVTIAVACAIIGGVYVYNKPASVGNELSDAGLVPSNYVEQPENTVVTTQPEVVSPTTPVVAVKPATKPAPVTPTPTPSTPTTSAPAPKTTTTKARIVFLHHSTGEYVYNGGVEGYFDNYNNNHGTQYQITPTTYPDTKGGYPWANYPYDYWNLWVNHTGTSQDQGEQNLDQIAANYDVIVFKHCYPVSGIGEDNGNPDVASSAMTVANYKLQYAALKARMKQFPNKKFIVWTGAALNSGSTNPGDAQRAKEFFTWVNNTWDEPGDNIYVWDFYSLETEGGLYLKDAYASDANDPHPNVAFSKKVAPYFAQRVIDVIEGRGDTGSVTGK